MARRRRAMGHRHRPVSDPIRMIDDLVAYEFAARLVPGANSAPPCRWIETAIDGGDEDHAQFPARCLHHDGTTFHLFVTDLDRAVNHAVADAAECHARLDALTGKRPPPVAGRRYRA